MTQPNSQPAKTDQTIWIYLSYILGWIFALIGLATVKDDKRVRFHCAQALAMSIVVFVVWIVLMILQGIFLLAVPFLWVLFSWIIGLVWIAFFVYVIYLLVQISQGKDPRVPICADFAEKNFIKLFL
jgi:uncharacterized membrane protein